MAEQFNGFLMVDVDPYNFEIQMTARELIEAIESKTVVYFKILHDNTDNGYHNYYNSYGLIEYHKQVLENAPYTTTYYFPCFTTSNESPIIPYTTDLDAKPSL